MSSTLKAVFFLLLVPCLVVQSATIRDYIDSAAHAVGLDSMVSSPSETSEVTDSPVPLDAEESSHETTCCDLPQPPCAVDVKVEKVIPVPVPAPVPVPVVPVAPCPHASPCATPCPAAVAPVHPLPSPACGQPPCPLDLNSARAASHSRMWEVALKGKSLFSTLTHAMAAPVVFTNSKISSAASYLPDLMAAKGRVLGHMVSAPVQFMAGKSSLLATGASAVVVGPPVAAGTAALAGVSGLVEAVKDLRRQQEACLCRPTVVLENKKEHHKKTEVKKEEKVEMIVVPVTEVKEVKEVKEHVPCPCSTPGSVLVAAGSDVEEKFTIDDPVTDSPVTESIGGSQSDARESVTVADFTTTSASTDVSE